MRVEMTGSERRLRRFGNVNNSVYGRVDEFHLSVHWPLNCDGEEIDAVRVYFHTADEGRSVAEIVFTIRTCWSRRWNGKDDDLSLH